MGVYHCVIMFDNNTIHLSPFHPFLTLSAVTFQTDLHTFHELVLRIETDDKNENKLSKKKKKDEVPRVYSPRLLFIMLIIKSSTGSLSSRVDFVL